MSRLPMSTGRSIVDYLAAQAASRPRAVALCHLDAEIGFGELEARSARCRGALAALGVAPGDRVALVMSDSPEMVIALLGIIGLGAAAVPLNPTLRAEELAFMLRDSAPRLVIASAEHAGVAAAAAGGTRLVVAPGELQRLLEAAAPAPLGPFARDTPCLVMYTSGSTGSPKGAVHVHGHLPETIERVAKAVYGLQPEDRVFSSSRLFFAYGLGNSFSFPLGVGASVVLCSERPTPASIAATFARYRPTVFFAVPAIFRGLIEHARQGNRLETQSLRYCICAGEALPRATWHEWKELTGVEILEGIGTTELLHSVIHNFPGRNRPGSAGEALPGYEIRLVDESGAVVEGEGRGSLHVRAPTAIPYYLNLPEVSAELLRDGWVRTGDIFRRDAEGYYWFEGRSDDLFKCSGQWVTPGEVEQALIGHPAVLEAAVVAATGATGATVPAAFVALRPDHVPGEALAAAILERAGGSLPRYKRPQVLHFVDALPRTATGKIQRFKLRRGAAPG